MYLIIIFILFFFSYRILVVKSLTKTIAYHTIAYHTISHNLWNKMKNALSFLKSSLLKSMLLTAKYYYNTTSLIALSTRITIWGSHLKDLLFFCTRRNNNLIKLLKKKLIKIKIFTYIWPQGELNKVLAIVQQLNSQCFFLTKTTSIFCCFRVTGYVKWNSP